MRRKRVATVRRNLLAILACAASTHATIGWGQEAAPANPPAAPAAPSNGPAQPAPTADQPSAAADAAANAPANQAPANAAPNAPPRQPPPNFNRRSNLASNLGGTRSSFSSAPTMMGDFFGGGVSTVRAVDRQSFSFAARGFILNGAPNGSSAAILGFDSTGGVIPNDFFTQGVGQDTVGNLDGADRFSITEPLPPNNAPTSPGPGYVYEGGTAVYTNDGTGNVQTAQPGTFASGDFWFVQYSYAQSLFPIGVDEVLLAGPDAASRRVKISENFSPEVRNRCFTNYSFFNDAYGGLGDISRWILGGERIIVDDLASIEVRLPMAGTYGSTQNLNGNPDRSYEIGNPTLILKTVLLRSEDVLWSAGSGLSLPLADDARLTDGVQDLLVIANQSYHVLPFTGAALRLKEGSYLQGYAQIDVDASGNPVYGDLNGGNLPLLGRFTDTTLLHLDLSYNHIVYRNARANGLTTMILNSELHYTTTINDADRVVAGPITVTNLTDQFNVLNATFGTHLVLGDHLVVTPGMAVPLRDGLDEQFDYEALVQVNYLW